MLINSSSTSPSSPLLCPVNASLYPIIFSCFNDSSNTIHYTTDTLTYVVFILPLSVLILWMGFRQYKSLTGQTSHTDIFTYYMSVLEVLTVFGMVSYCCGVYTCAPAVMVLGYFCVCISLTSQTLFHTLTCVERYLAVVYPIFYMRLKQSNGVRIRNIVILCVLSLSLMTAGILAVIFPTFPVTMYFSLFAFILLIVCYCSLAVFSVLIRSGMRSDQTKWRAFYTIIAITGALFLRFCGQVLSILILNSKVGAYSNECKIFIFASSWMCLPSSLVLPLLFLHKNGKLTCPKGSLNRGEPEMDK